jgi:hypothetical protein
MDELYETGTDPQALPNRDGRDLIDYFNNRMLMFVSRTTYRSRG